MHWKKGLWYVLLSLAVTSVGVVGFSYYTLTRLIKGRQETAYYREHAEKMYVQHAASPVRFKNSDGHTLFGMLIRREQAAGTVVFCHGYRHTHQSMMQMTKYFPEYNLLFFDFRSYGKSEGTYTSVGHHEYRDVIAATQFAKQRGLAGPLILFGASMGAAAIIKAVRRHPEIADILFLDAPYANFNEVLAHSFAHFVGLPHYPFMPTILALFTMMMGREVATMHPEDDIAHIDKPLLIMHSAGDFVTLPEHSVRLYNKVGTINKRSRLWVGPSAEHCQMYRLYPDLYKHKIRKFLAKAREWLRVDD